VVSAYLDAGTIEKIKQLGADSYVKKPFTSQQVIEALKNVLTSAPAPAEEEGGDAAAEK